MKTSYNYRQPQDLNSELLILHFSLFYIRVHKIKKISFVMKHTCLLLMQSLSIATPMERGWQSNIHPLPIQSHNKLKQYVAQT